MSEFHVCHMQRLEGNNFPWMHGCQSFCRLLLGEVRYVYILHIIISIAGCPSPFPRSGYIIGGIMGRPLYLSSTSIVAAHILLLADSGPRASMFYVRDQLFSSGGIEVYVRTAPKTFAGPGASHPSYGARGRALVSAIVFLVLRWSFCYGMKREA